MSVCDQQGLSDVILKCDGPVLADIVRQAAQAIVASVHSPPSSIDIGLKHADANEGPAVEVQRDADQRVEGPLEQDQQKSRSTIQPIHSSSSPTPPPPTLSAPPTSPSIPAPSPSSAPLDARSEFSPLPSSPALPVFKPQVTAPVTSAVNELTHAQPSQSRVQKPKGGIGRFWRERVWSLERKAVVQRISRIAIYGLTIWFAYVGIMIVAYRFIDPPASNLMLYNYLQGNTVHHSWVPIEKISPAVIKAVVVAEDAQFCRHWGIDFAAIQYAIEHARGGTPRGASTISMQTAKNMFLWQSKSYIRKILEVPVTVMMELVWPKKRMLEIYLNIAEWGPGVFGIGAAAKHHFKTTPANLNTAAAARLAASLPNPKVRRAGRPGPKTRRKANVIRGRARHAGYYTGCVLR